MKDKKEEKVDSEKSSKINDGLCCRCTKRNTEKICKITGKHVARKHKCDAKIKGKLAFSYKD